MVLPGPGQAGVAHVAGPAGLGRPGGPEVVEHPVPPAACPIAGEVLGLLRSRRGPLPLPVERPLDGVPVRFPVGIEVDGDGVLDHSNGQDLVPFGSEQQLLDLVDVPPALAHLQEVERLGAEAHRLSHRLGQAASPVGRPGRGVHPIRPVRGHGHDTALNGIGAATNRAVDLQVQQGRVDLVGVAARPAGHLGLSAPSATRQGLPHPADDADVGGRALHEVLVDAAVPGGVQQHAGPDRRAGPVRGPPSGPAGLLHVVLDGPGHLQVQHQRHIGLVHPQPESVGAHDDADLADGERLFGAGPQLGVHAPVVGQSRVPVGPQQAGEVHGVVAPGHVDDGWSVPERPQHLQHPSPSFPNRFALLDAVAQLGTIRAAGDHPVAAELQPQLGGDVGQGLGGGGGGEGGNGRALGSQPPDGVGDPEVLRPEVVAPLGHAVSLVHHDQAHLHVLHGLAEAGLPEPLGGDVQQPVEAGAHPFEDLVLLGLSLPGVEGGYPAVAASAHPLGLIAHQGDQGRGDQGHAGQQRGRDLVDQRLAAAGGQHRQHICAFPRQDLLHQLPLPGPPVRDAHALPDGFKALSDQAQVAALSGVEPKVGEVVRPACRRRKPVQIGRYAVVPRPAQVLGDGPVSLLGRRRAHDGARVVAGQGVQEDLAIGQGEAQALVQHHQHTPVVGSADQPPRALGEGQHRSGHQIVPEPVLARQFHRIHASRGERVVEAGEGQLLDGQKPEGLARHVHPLPERAGSQQATGGPVPHRLDQLHGGLVALAQDFNVPAGQQGPEVVAGLQHPTTGGEQAHATAFGQDEQAGQLGGDGFAHLVQQRSRRQGQMAGQHHQLVPGQVLERAGQSQRVGGGDAQAVGHVGEAAVDPQRRRCEHRGAHGPPQRAQHPGHIDGQPPQRPLPTGRSRAGRRGVDRTGRERNSGWIADWVHRSRGSGRITGRSGGRIGGQFGHGHHLGATGRPDAGPDTPRRLAQLLASPGDMGFQSAPTASREIGRIGRAGDG